MHTRFFWELRTVLLSFRFPKPSATERAATHARRRLAHPFQQFFQHSRVIVLLVSRRIQQRDLSLAFRKVMQLLHCRGTLFAYQLFEIAFPEYAPCLRILMEPPPQLVRRRHLAQPELKRRVFFLQPARPQTIDQHAHSVRRRRSLVNAFDGNGHAFRIILLLPPSS